MITPTPRSPDDRDILVPLTDEEVAEFQRLMKEECGEDITLGEARFRATELLGLVGMLARVDEKRPAVSVERPASVPEPSDLHWLTEQLDEFREVLRIQIAPRADWRSGLPPLATLLRQTLERAIAEKRAPDEALGSRFVSFEGSSLLDLFDRAERELKATLSGEARSALQQIGRLMPERDRLTPATWKVLADVLPGYARHVLTMVEALGWAPGFLAGVEGATRAYARQTYGHILAMLYRMERRSRE